MAVEARLFVAVGDVARAMEVLDAHDGLRIADIAAAEVAAAVAARDLESARKVLATFPDGRARGARWSNVCCGKRSSKTSTGITAKEGS